ncbi:MAG: hypothetical protein K1X94_16650 [Sandaracinaceae bacterium]|nr:hypothetical protein [Sandaracinaceae bacterium]
MKNVGLLVCALVVMVGCAPTVARVDSGHRDAGPGARSRCGDGRCEPTEVIGCALDCHCGDGFCDPRAETQGDCALDCPSLPDCGDGACDRRAGETAYLCAVDCPALCSDGFCDRMRGETAASCAIDCACGDGRCDADLETARTCPDDCDSECGDGDCDPRDEDVGCEADCTCGNGTCDAGETNEACPEDCLAEGCGDGECAATEDFARCGLDCAWVPSCGDGGCDETEDPASCPLDCEAGPRCGDGACDASESTSDCPDDCAGGPLCGDGACGGAETEGTCPVDCAADGACGDTRCDGSESAVSCALDCANAGCGDGACDPISESVLTCEDDCVDPGCGDLVCDPAREDELSCAEDCAGDGICNDGVCDGGEDPVSCPEDCPLCGDHVCAGAEDAASCDLDCGVTAASTGARALAGCPYPTELVLYAPSGYRVLAEQLATYPSRCVESWITVPVAPSRHTEVPRGPQNVRLSPTIHAAGEFNYNAWVVSLGGVEASHGADWLAIGRDYHHALEEAGYRPDLGDTWSMNEATSKTPTSPETRADLRELVRGLYEGRAELGDQPMRGVFYTYNRPHGGAATYKPELEQWLADGAFWADMQRWVRFWAQETYVDPTYLCERSLDGRAKNLTDYAMHVMRVVDAPGAPSSVASARSYLHGAYVPLMSAYWLSPGAYGHTSNPPIGLDRMESLISEQTRAARRWWDAHPGQGARLGFAFGIRAPRELSAGSRRGALERLGRRVALSVRGAFGSDAIANGACYRGTARAYCDFSISCPSTRTTRWDTFGRW